MLLMRLDGRNSRLHLEHQLRLQLEQECVDTGAGLAQDTQKQHPLIEMWDPWMPQLGSCFYF